MIDLPLTKRTTPDEIPVPNLGTIELFGIHESSDYHPKNFKPDPSDANDSLHSKTFYNLSQLEFPCKGIILVKKSEHLDCPLIYIPQYNHETEYLFEPDFTVTHFIISDENQRKIWANAEDGSK